MFHQRVFPSIGIVLGLGIAAATAQPDFPGPVQATVQSVLDGDTLRALALVWPGHTVAVNIRIRGIDAPEMKSSCWLERQAALRARDALAQMIGAAPVTISNISGAKYYGRVLADVTASDGRDIATELAGLLLVRRYDGGRRGGWC